MIQFNEEDIGRATRDIIAKLVVENNLQERVIQEQERQIARLEATINAGILPEPRIESYSNGGPGSPSSDLSVHQSRNGSELRDELELER